METLRYYTEADFPMTVKFTDYSNELKVFETIKDYQDNKRPFVVVKAHWKSGLAEYRCHQIIKAGKLKQAIVAGKPIVAIVEDCNDNDFQVEMPDDAFKCGGIPVIGDYIVIYEDGYKSWWPAKVFEEGYNRIERS